ncbi:unnamed protein product [Onchocerca flexuosa]|uniref:Uncharacterized protein n=1 Tax=Onchocerca flexuosa TaxID=387005 RepID=A0A183HJ95_9BILA|nr:unnamed protein product [Onchocerca flexuosa]
MTSNIILVILLSSKIICEAQDNSCFMSGSLSGYSTLCGENSKDEENLKDPVEIMKRAKEFLEKQNKILLDPMTWTIPPLSSLQTFPPPSINTTPVEPISDPLLVFQPNGMQVQSQSPYIPLNPAAVANNAAYSLLIPISKNPTNIHNLKFLPYIGIVSSDKSKVLQNSPISVNQANFPYHLENSLQITRSQQQFQNQANDIVNKTNEMPHLIKIPPPPKFLTEYQNQKAKDNNDLTDMNSTKPVKLFLNRRFIYQKTTH